MQASNHGPALYLNSNSMLKWNLSGLYKAHYFIFFVVEPDSSELVFHQGAPECDTSINGARISHYYESIKKKHCCDLNIAIGILSCGSIPYYRFAGSKCVTWKIAEPCSSSPNANLCRLHFHIHVSSGEGMWVVEHKFHTFLFISCIHFLCLLARAWIQI